MKRNDNLSKVNTPPIGLQNLLGNVNQGVNPHELDQIITPSVDLYPHWATNKIRAAFETAEVAGAVGQGLGISVPEGELWQVIAAECAYETVSATTDTSISVGVMDPTLTTMVSFYTIEFLNVPGLTGDYQVVGGPFPDRFILGGGWSIRGQVNGSTVATVRTMNVKLLYVKLSE